MASWKIWSITFSQSCYTSCCWSKQKPYHQIDFSYCCISNFQCIFRIIMFGLEDEVMNYLKMQVENDCLFLIITLKFYSSQISLEIMDNWTNGNFVHIMWLVLLIFGDFCKWFMLVHKWCLLWRCVIKNKTCRRKVVESWKKF